MTTPVHSRIQVLLLSLLNNGNQGTTSLKLAASRTRKQASKANLYLKGNCVDQFATNRIFLETEAALCKKHPERVHQLELVRSIASLKAKARCYQLPTDVDRLAREAGIIAI